MISATLYASFFWRVSLLLPAAAEIPLREPRTWSGKVSDGSMNVVELGPKLLKKNVKLSSRCRHIHHQPPNVRYRAWRLIPAGLKTCRADTTNKAGDAKESIDRTRYDVERWGTVQAPRSRAAKPGAVA